MLLRTFPRFITTIMPATRSSTRSATATPLKRKGQKKRPSTPSKLPKKAKRLATAVATQDDFIPADGLLTFSFEEAKRHLIQADERFEDVFNRVDCKPFQELEQLHPFMCFLSALLRFLGQQISWMAARSIRHRFIRLYDETIPEKWSDYSGSFFPTAENVAETDIPKLRSAGLSQRKAEYILDLAARFSDGRLSAKKLMESTDEELAEMLLEVRGVGRVIDMFAIFSLRRPDILPVGDLGVQRGLVRWVLSQHSSTYSYTISPEKDKAASPEKKKGKKSKAKEDEDTLPVFGQAEESPQTPPAAEDASAVVPLPPTFTPSIKRTLEKTPPALPALPQGLSVSELKSRLDGKKKVKGALLSPQHMEELTESWKPYRSLGVYYMWSLADAEV
ncbi:DNA glycosylase [Roridomyces roridus]|uniref:DNA glycosylase n=1 Tax=Roridomyces roridus TaxID=1738132 RepID=A0AAD7CF85_9AGAR|nr:DNA glycosylase [Roridomyces roridus]